MIFEHILQNFLIFCVTINKFIGIGTNLKILDSEELWHSLIEIIIITFCNAKTCSIIFDIQTWRGLNHN